MNYIAVDRTGFPANPVNGVFFEWLFPYPGGNIARAPFHPWSPEWNGRDNFFRNCSRCGLVKTGFDCKREDICLMSLEQPAQDTATTPVYIQGKTLVRKNFHTKTGSLIFFVCAATICRMVSSSEMLIFHPG